MLFRSNPGPKGTKPDGDLGRPVLAVRVAASRRGAVAAPGSHGGNHGKHGNPGPAGGDKPRPYGMQPVLSDRAGRRSLTSSRPDGQARQRECPGGSPPGRRAIP